MIAGAGSPDCIDRFLFAHLDAWIALRWHDGPVRPPMGVPYGTHLATLVHCPPGGEIRGLNFCWLVESAPKEFYRVGEVLDGIQATWLFRHETLRKFDLTALHPFQVEALALPQLDLGGDLPGGLRDFRRRRDLDAYRHPGYPDDLSSEYLGRSRPVTESRLQRERLWVRVKLAVSSSELESELLNTPELSEGAAGQAVTTYIKGVGSDLEIFSVPHDGSETSRELGASLEADKVIPLVPCLTIGCDGTPLNISPSVARAHIEHHLHDDPTFRFVVSCDRCGMESHYSLDAVVAMIPSSRRPSPLRTDELIVVLLSELATSPEMDRSFFGERLLARRLTTSANGGGLAELLVTSAMAPSLRRGDTVHISQWDRFPIVQSVVRSGLETPVDIAVETRSNAIGIFLSPKTDPEQLRMANVPCRNPSCCMVFSTTYSEYLHQSRDATSAMQRIGADSAGVWATCVACGTSRVIDDRSFEGLAKI